jgi:hypothetical protein
VADGDVVLADHDLADDESDDLLALLDGEVLGVDAQTRPESFERLGQFEVGLGVVQFGVERVQLRVQRGLALAELRGACAEFIEGDELLLVAVEQSPQGALRAGEVALERVTTVSGGVRGA